MPSEACVMQPARGGHSLNAPGSTDTKSPSSIHVLGWLLKTWTMEWTAKDMLLSDRCTSPIFSQMRSRTSYSLRRSAYEFGCDAITRTASGQASLTGRLIGQAEALQALKAGAHDPILSSALLVKSTLMKMCITTKPLV